MEALGSVDDLLDFSSDIGEDDNDDEKPRKAFPPLNPLDVGDPNHSSSDFAEEELEWLSNKDAFPAIETFVELTSIQPIISQHQRTATTPMLENNTNSITLLSDLKVPVRARSKSRSRPRTALAATSCSVQPSSKISKEVIIERKCHHCRAEKTPLWRAGPNGPKTLCNACGVRFKSGRLVPEYRPASSPTFRSDLHSNSHKKIVEMRKQKQKK